MVSPALRYTTLRLLLLIGSVLVLFALGLRGLLLLAVAFVLSGILSYFLLNSARDAMAERIATRFRTWNRRIDDSARAEDDDPPPPAS